MPWRQLCKRPRQLERERQKRPDLSEQVSLSRASRGGLAQGWRAGASERTSNQVSKQRIRQGSTVQYEQYAQHRTEKEHAQ
ncbi:hypothetical protein KTAU_42900 [Thermogemmatispora aurantia]|uniref:Uncharacterized protein n=1 Tax=Thermogemmatispora aurantia TaxID=2045279 RepID=A0A5J4KJZ1_9CHLR|nr:hypothetical protein KTAU_42900 [Thermogemmatispora aurantia]